MDGWFGAVFGFGTRYLAGMTARIVRHYLPKVASLPWTWLDSGDLADAEARGGVTGCARRL